MITRRLLASETKDFATAEDILRSGGIVAVPTETVYGLAADATQPEAVSAIFDAKGRPVDHPLIVHIASVDEIEKWAVEIPEHAYTLARAFWPGPLTLLLKKAAHVSSVVTGGLETIGLRVPSHPALLELLQSSGLGLAAPSANPYKQLSPTSAEQVLIGDEQLSHTNFGVVWSPFNGKTAFYSKALNYFDLYLFAGAGVVVKQTQTDFNSEKSLSVKPEGALGGGLAFYLGSNALVRLDFRQFVFEKIIGGVANPSEVSLGFGSFF